MAWYAELIHAGIAPDWSFLWKAATVLGPASPAAGRGGKAGAGSPWPVPMGNAERAAGSARRAGRLVVAIGAASLVLPAASPAKPRPGAGVAPRGGVSMSGKS